MGAKTVIKKNDSYVCFPAQKVCRACFSLLLTMKNAQSVLSNAVT